MTITTIDGGIGLYRIWGDADLLLYIGISNNFGRRWREHAKRQPWWGEMRRLTVDCWYPSRDEAEEAETAAIKAESPKYNVRKTVSKAAPLAKATASELDYDAIVRGCDRAIHSMWHDGYSRGRAEQLADKSYEQLRNSESRWMCAVKVRETLLANWGARDDCLLCQQGFRHPADYVPMEIRAAWDMSARRGLAASVAP